MMQILLGLAVIAMLMPVCTLSIAVLCRQTSFDHQIQDEIALTQLRRMLIVADSLEISGAELNMEYQGEIRCLQMVNSNLIMKPGTLIFLPQIEDCRFRKEGNVFLLSWQRSGVTQERAIAYAP
jgi:hypothetical protein